MWAHARAELREGILDAYQRNAPELLGEQDPIHPASPLPRDAEEWRRGVGASDGLEAAEVRDYEWSQTYSAGGYAALLATHSTVRVLEPTRRAALVDAVARSIESHGNSLTLPLLTRLCLARRCDRSRPVK